MSYEEITAKAQKRLEQITEELNAEDSDIMFEPLSISKVITHTIMLSYGGPEDGFKIAYSEDNELLGGVYYFKDWGTYDETPITNEQAEQIAELYGLNQ